MKDFFSRASSCKDDLNICSKVSTTRDKININAYSFGSKTVKDIPPNYFCLINEKNMDYPGLYINNTDDITHVFFQQEVAAGEFQYTDAEGLKIK